MNRGKGPFVTSFSPPPTQTHLVSLLRRPASFQSYQQRRHIASIGSRENRAGTWLYPPRRVSGRRSQCRSCPASIKPLNATMSASAQVVGWMRARAIQPLLDGRDETCRSCEQPITSTDRRACADIQLAIDPAVTSAPSPSRAVDEQARYAEPVSAQVHL